MSNTILNSTTTLFDTPDASAEELRIITCLFQEYLQLAEQYHSHVSTDPELAQINELPNGKNST